MTEAPHIEVRNLSHHYRLHRDLVLSDIDFTLGQGESLAVIGRSGCGKSTLLHHLAGLLHPSSGTILVGGEAVKGPSPQRIMMFQQPLLYPWMTVFQNASLGLRFAGRKAGMADSVYELLERLGLAEYANTNVQQLSGGQQQRVALARSLALKPELLLLDEPFSALDAFTRQDLQAQVRAMAKSLGITLVLVTHDIDEAVRMADRALVMGAGPGRIVADLTFGLNGDRSPDNPSVQFERARLLTILGETTDTPQPGAYYAI